MFDGSDRQAHVFVRRDETQAVALDGLQVGAAGDEDDVQALQMQTAAQDATNSTGSIDDVAHAFLHVLMLSIAWTRLCGPRCAPRRRALPAGHDGSRVPARSWH